MATAAATRPVRLLAPPPPPAPADLFIGTAFSAAAVVMVFVGLIGIYIRCGPRPSAGGTAWRPGGVTPLTAPNVAFGTLLMSVVTMQWAVCAIGNRDRTNAYVALGIDPAGAAFANSTAHLYSQMGLVIADSVVGVLIYAITGAHLIFTIGALFTSGWSPCGPSAASTRPATTRAQPRGALFWYATVGVYSLIWYVIFITSRGVRRHDHQGSRFGSSGSPLLAYVGAIVHGLSTHGHVFGCSRSAGKASASTSATRC